MCSPSLPLGIMDLCAQAFSPLMMAGLATEVWIVWFLYWAPSAAVWGRMLLLPPFLPVQNARPLRSQAWLSEEGHCLKMCM
jgi:hypothetical protein